VTAVQWAAGIELALLIDSDKVILTTDHPNGGPFTRYPELIALFMSKKYRDKYSEMNNAIERRTGLLTIDRELDFYEIAQITRANPAKSAGMEKIKGHIAVYDINPLEFDSSDYEKIEKALSTAFLTLKDGEIVLKEGKIVKETPGRTYWVNPDVDSAIEPDLNEYFRKYYSVSLSNYFVQKDELVRGEIFTLN
jgi:formylmethanofuran dehydrogenase subunit A